LLICIEIDSIRTGRDRKVVVVGSVSVVWPIWKTRNISCFQKNRYGDPQALLLLFIISLTLRRNCKKNGLRKLLLHGARKMAHVAQEVFGQNHGWNPMRRRITT
jgi:hypothetical protein